MIRSKHPQSPCLTSLNTNNILSESGWSLRVEQLLVAGLGDTVGKRELEVLGNELLNVGALDVGGLLELNDAENL